MDKGVGKHQKVRPVAAKMEIRVYSIGTLRGRQGLLFGPRCWRTKRDFIDLEVSAQRFGLADLLNLFDRKYAQTGYSKIHLLKSLTFFEDADKDAMPHMLIDLDWIEVKKFFRREV